MGILAFGGNTHISNERSEATHSSLIAELSSFSKGRRVNRHVRRLDNRTKERKNGSGKRLGRDYSGTRLTAQERSTIGKHALSEEGAERRWGLIQ